MNTAASHDRPSRPDRTGAVVFALAGLVLTLLLVWAAASALGSWRAWSQLPADAGSRPTLQSSGGFPEPRTREGWTRDRHPGNPARAHDPVGPSIKRPSTPPFPPAPAVSCERTAPTGSRA